MAANLKEEFSFSSLPLLFDEKLQSFGCKLEEVESSFVHATTSTTSFFKTCFNGLNALSGVGILSVPYAVASGGWLSLTLLLTIAIVVFYTGILVQRCMEFDSDIRSYPDIGKRAFGNKGRTVLSIIMLMDLYLCAIVFLILEGDNLYNLFPNNGLQISGIAVDGKQCFVVIVGIVILPSLWLDNLSLLSYVSASGVLASAIILVSILWTGAFEGVGFHHEGKLLNLPGIPTAVSLFAFCYSAHPVIPTLYNSIENKRQFSNVLILCFTVCTLGYITMAIFGYLMFGSSVESQITLNLPVGKLSSRIAIYTTLVAPIAKYPMAVTPIVDAAMNYCPSHVSKRLFGILVSTALLIGSITVALVLPFLADLMSLVGAFLGIAASIIVPCVCYLKICGDQIYRCEMVAVGCVILFGFVVLVFGTYTSITEVVGEF
ncbi:hypothetical protein FNV43_RR13675 [Rhamnella rubrinervis]|uniref:Amino acid transporter transmembrane domain-containing protein n=1 Tax=Rhamnella rubrinervis TaxID=2594499 RepID=A0A8K0H1R4_9ROSA|nr:hypothetical protein FNV43_RR13675 [Rhamnella rubrinervis]